MPSHEQADLGPAELLGLLLKAPLIFFFAAIKFFQQLSLKKNYSKLGIQKAVWTSIAGTLPGHLSIAQLRALQPPSKTLINAYCKSIQLMVSNHSIKVPGPENFPNVGLHSVSITNPTSAIQLSESHELPVLLYVHGGGFVFAISDGHVAWAIHAARNIRGCAKLLLLEYNVAPEHKYPSQLAQTIAALKYIIDPLPGGLGISPSRLVIGGDSAGGTIVLGLLAHLTNPCPRISSPQLDLRPALGSQKFRGVFVISPAVTQEVTSSSWKTNAIWDVIDARQMKGFLQHYAPITREIWTTALSGDANFWATCLSERVSKTLISVGEKEVFRDDIQQMAKLMGAVETKGGDVELQIAKGEIHAQTVLDTPVGDYDGLMTKGACSWLSAL